MSVLSSRQFDERVLILTSASRDGDLAEATLCRASIDTHVCRTWPELLEEMERGASVVVLAEEALVPDAVTSLVEFADRQPAWSDLPLILINCAGDSAPGSAGALVDSEPLGNVTRLEHPVGVVTLVSAVRTALRARRRQYEVRDHLAERRRSDEGRERLLSAEQAARAEVEAANRAKDEFLALLSHELRTPLQSMLGWVKVPRMGGADERTVTRALEALERSTRIQAQLIEDLLDVSRIVAGKMRVEAEPTALAPVVEAALDSVRAAADAKGVRIEARMDGVDLDVLGDAYRLQQVVWNLLSNAVKFTSKGGRVGVTVRRTEAHAVIVVSDTGQGIPPEVLPHVFDRFRQADSTSTRAAGGLGLGLAIVRHLVELHGGTVEATSEGAGHGATFTVRLPLLPASERAAIHLPDESSRAAGVAGNGLLSGLRLLVVEDDADTSEMLTALLHRDGAYVWAAHSVEDALRTLAWLRPDVVVSDISMPGEVGNALARRLRARERWEGARVPTLALTAHARPEDSEHAFLAGFDAHLAKPVDPAGLSREIARLAGRLGGSDRIGAGRSWRSGPRPDVPGAA